MEVEAAASKEEEIDLQKQVELGLKLETMTSTEGWNDVFLPWLRAMQKNFESGILAAKELREFIAAQQNINLIDVIINYVNINIKEGKGASERLSRN